MNRKQIMIGIAGLVLLGLLILALKPSPIPVSATEVRRGPFTEYVEDEGETHLPEPHHVSAPISGFLRRVDLDPGDRVEAGDTLFELESLPTPALDARAREQARERVSAAQARLQAAEAELEARESQHELAQKEYERAQRLHERGAISAEERDRRRSQRDSARAAERSARHAVEVARFELEAARAVVEIADGERAPLEQPSLSVRAPITGTVTRVYRCCEGPVQAGEEILQIGDLSTLEVRVDLLSMDAVRVEEGMRVVLDRWGRDDELEGRVHRVEPAGYTRVSALGVDEQRVPVRVEITSPREQWPELGDAFRVEARFILWEGEDVVQVPSSALFRRDDSWAIFVVEDGQAVLKTVKTGRRSGLWTQVTDGLSGDEVVITHPGDRIESGVGVEVDLRGYQ
ncbi:HlyD family secretion protein [Halospina denitrificans]|uniref:HlyD family secretion protein n=1 Tax=Halospina denitrificans TaxID=332522 RepID=A0A4R7JRN2_9GAMM|nr:HlyD family efflux transporter periplasmic adaptor subunit [Halospina denitrificans]TDT40406.1 HlyD family secretion protein [Halospina denitrificans]